MGAVLVIRRSDNVLIAIIMLSLMLQMIMPSWSSSAILSVVQDYGARSGAKFDSTQAFVAAWTHACASTAPATIYVPSGTFLVRTILFRGPCKNNATVFKIDGTLVAPSDYSVIGNAGNWLLFNRVTGVSVQGGLLDAQGTALWACKASSSTTNSCPSGATSLGLRKSENVVISGVTSLNSHKFHIVIDGCKNVSVEGVKIRAPDVSPNTDGIHVEESNGVTVVNATIGTGDDCISVGPGCSNLWIENVRCGPGHGISIGSLGKKAQEDGVQNVTVKSVSLKGTTNGVRIKTWARPSSGFVRNVLFQDVVMSDVKNPIIIDQDYCPNDNNCPGQVSGVGISKVVYKDIKGTSATATAVRLECSSGSPCKDIRMEGVMLSYKGKIAKASCANAAGVAYGMLHPTSCLS